MFDLVSFRVCLCMHNTHKLVHLILGQSLVHHGYGVLQHGLQKTQIKSDGFLSSPKLIYAHYYSRLNHSLIAIAILQFKTDLTLSLLMALAFGPKFEDNYLHVTWRYA